jgi:hypothetical protein
LRSCGYLGWDRQRNLGLFSGMVRGVSNACEGSKILSFLFRPRLVWSSLLDLRCSWKVDSANNVALCVFSEVLHGTGPMRRGFLYGFGIWKLCVHTFPVKLALNSQKCCEKQEICRKKDAQPLNIHSEFIASW